MCCDGGNGFLRSRTPVGICGCLTEVLGMAEKDVDETMMLVSKQDFHSLLVLRCGGN